MVGTLPLRWGAGGVGCLGTYSGSHMTSIVSRESHVDGDHHNYDLIILGLAGLGRLTMSPPGPVVGGLTGSRRPTDG